MFVQMKIVTQQFSELQKLNSGNGFLVFSILRKVHLLCIIVEGCLRKICTFFTIQYVLDNDNKITIGSQFHSFENGR